MAMIQFERDLVPSNSPAAHESYIQAAYLSSSVESHPSEQCGKPHRFISVRTRSSAEPYKTYNSSMYLQAASAAAEPSAQAVVSWRTVFFRQSPATKTPGVLV